MGNVGGLSGRHRGIALMISLFLTVFLFVLGITLLYFLDQDSRFGLEMQRSQQAQALAQAGLFYARGQEAVYGPDAIHNPGIGYFEYWTDATQTQGFRLWKDADAERTVHSKGLIRTTDGKVLATREMAAASSHPPMSFSTSANRMSKWAWDVDL